MSRRSKSALALPVFAIFLALASAAALAAAPAPPRAGVFRGTLPVVKFDVSPPLREIPPRPIPDGSLLGALMVDPPSQLEGELGPQDVDPLVQGFLGAGVIPAPLVSFDGQGNIANFAPPDPVGDVGPGHYVSMSNVHFAIYDKAGGLLFGPAASNTLWAGFGGACEAENAGDPIVLHDQLADRWVLTQFTAAGPTYFNCVAVSTTPDPTGSYFRYAISTGSNFPDYPKYGVWPDALYISTREFSGSTFVGIGAYAIERANLVAGNPITVLSFFVPPGATPYDTGDGLLPSDLDGDTLPPAGSPNYFVGSMDNGGPYGAPQDALTLWKFVADFTTPANSTFTLANTIPIAAVDTMFPCSPGGRNCIPQPGTANKVDILSYRQRPLHRLAYRNFGTHESLVTNQAVEATTGIAGIRWWEIRSPNAAPAIFQEGTYAPGATDGIHRWMGSIAMDGAGNMALGYSASDGTSTFPSSWYTGRLAGSPAGVMDLGEGSIIDGTGSQTGSARWGDYTSMNVDPVDDCTFWYVNQYNPTTSSIGWRLRIGAFRLPGCEGTTADLGITKTDGQATAVAGAPVVYTITATNAGPDPVTGALVSDTFPALCTSVAWTCTSSGGAVCPANGSGNLAASVDLPMGGQAVFTATCATAPGAIGTLTNTATIAVPAGFTDPEPGNDSATDVTGLLSPANLEATKTVAGSFFPNEVVTYTITITNTGPGTQIDNPGDELTDTLPAELSLVAASASAGTVTTAGDTVSWNGSLAAAASVSVQIDALIGATAFGRTIVNQGTLFYDADGDGTNEATRPTDDPVPAGTADPTVFVTGSVLEVPTVSVGGLALLGLLLAGASLHFLRRRRAA